MSTGINSTLRGQDRTPSSPAVPQKCLERFLEYSLLVTLSAIPFVLFYTTRLKSTFDHVSILLLVVWFVVIRGRTQRTLPRYLIIAALLYSVSFLISAGISESTLFKLPEINSLRIPLLAGLLYVMPFRPSSRKIIIVILFTVSATIGVIGIFQYFGILFPQMNRPCGIICMPSMYPAMISFVCGSVTVLLLIRKSRDHLTTREKIFLAIILVCTAGGVVIYQARGVWIAFTVAIIITMVLHNKHKAILITVVLLIIATMMVSFSNRLREQAASIVTSIYTEDETGNTGNRFELWKASWMIFARSPILGTGLWDFQNDVNDLIREGKIKNVPTTFHAHNIYLHNLATRGIVGLFATAGLLAALLWWGLSLARSEQHVGGYIIIFCTLVMIIYGMTEVSFADGSPFAFTYWFTIGLLDPGQMHRIAQDS